jgi:para-aminobenzoate synthetase component 1
VGLVVVELDHALEPIDALERLAGLPFPVLLDSAADRDGTGRYSYLAADPVATFHGSAPDDLLADAERMVAQFPARSEPDLPPFQGGLAGFIAYDYARLLERLPVPRPGDPEIPDVFLGLYDWVIAWDHRKAKVCLISTGIPMMGPHRVPRARERSEGVLARLRDGADGVDGRPQRESPRHSVDSVGSVDSVLASPNFTPKAYRSAVQRVRDYILAGDVFQVNLSQRFDAPLSEPPLELYRRLRSRNPAPFAAYIDGGAFQVLSASPERFLRVEGRQVETRPIKGTRPRGTTPAADAALAAELRASEKDRAENVMIVDLLRNDLSRVCRPGTVRATELLRLESHPTVHHLVSVVEGTLESDRSAFDLLRAAFPGGSITGAPKLRAMEIIAELERSRRSIYCGAIGYVSLTGDMDTSIVIRTLVAAGGRVWFQAGGGIVADSDPAAEYEETLDKARALIEAVER